MPLPEKLPDKYQDVDHTRYDTIPNMTRAELLEMSELALARQDAHSATRWKDAALQHARDEEIAASAARMDDMLQAHPMPPPGGILEPAAALPWQGDSEWQSLRATFDKAKAKTDALQDHDPEKVKLMGKQADAWDALREREASIKEDLGEIGAFTEQDQRVLDAQRQLEIKAEKVARQFEVRP